MLLLLLQQLLLGSAADACVSASISCTISCCCLSVAAAVVMRCPGGALLSWGRLFWGCGPIVRRYMLPLLLFRQHRFWVLLK
jgi:hypothetical protein